MAASLALAMTLAMALTLDPPTLALAQKMTLAITLALAQLEDVKPMYKYSVIQLSTCSS